jgi:hypothetical protein
MKIKLENIVLKMDEINALRQACISVSRTLKRER